MLEELKHIFAIEGIVFVIATDTVQLSHSVNALYGEKFESQKYLRRFFDRVLVFPPVSRTSFLDALVEDSSIEWDMFSAADNGVKASVVFLSLFESQNYSNRDIVNFIELLDTFVASWDEDFPIEPVSLGALIDDYLHEPTKFATATELIGRDRRGAGWTAVQYVGQSINLNNVSSKIVQIAHTNLAQYNDNWPAREYFVREYNARVAGKPLTGPVESAIASYRDRILLSARTVAED